MSGFTITITDAGRAALINAQNTGTNAFVLSQIGVSTQHITSALTDLVTLPDERKRLGTMAGDVVSDDTLHVTIRDEGNDAYPMRAFGLYTSTGILFAVYSQPDPIIEKSAAAMLLLAVDAKLVALSTDQVEFGPVGFTLPPASETVAGITEVATDAEADAGTDNWRYITPRLLKRALAALSGFALIGHKHDAADTTTGVFNVGRIPALGMEKITGLAVALAGKAAETHTHTIAQITNLSETLGAKAAALHQHHADEIAQGVLAVARIPDLAMSKITDLAAALGGKADRQHSHDAADTTSGVFNVGRIPTLAMEKITGLANALAAKANLYAPIFEGLITSPNVAIRNTVSSWRSLKFFSGLSERWALMMNTALEDDAANTGGDLLLTAGMSDGTSRDVMRFDRATQKARFFQTPHVNGYDIHHKGDLRPASNSETLAGALGAERYITPAGLWSFAKSIGPSGYQQIPGTDLIIQWGFSAASIPEGQIHAILPVAFGGGCLTAMAICRNPTSNTGNDFWMQIVDKYLDRIVFLANRSGTGGNVSGYEWLAIGLARGTPNPVYSTGNPPGGGSGGGEYNPEL